MIRLFFCLFVIILFPFRVNAMELIERGRDTDKHSQGEDDHTGKNSKLEEEQADKKQAARVTGDEFTDDDDQQGGTSVDRASRFTLSQEYSDSRDSSVMSDMVKQLHSAQEVAQELKRERLEAAQAIMNGFLMSSEEREAIRKEIQDTCNEWSAKSIAYCMMKSEVQVKEDCKKSEIISALLDAAEEVVKEAKYSLYLFFPKEVGRTVRFEGESKEGMYHDVSSSSLREQFAKGSDCSSPAPNEEPKFAEAVRRVYFSAATQEREERTHVGEKPLPHFNVGNHYPYDHFFHEKGSMLVLKAQLEKKEFFHQDAIRSLAAQKEERDLAIKAFRKKHRFQLCKSSSPILEDYLPRIRALEGNIEQHASDLKEMHEMLQTHQGNVSFFASQIREEIGRKIISWKEFSRESTSLKYFLTLFDKELHKMSESFFTHDFSLSDVDREKITWEELMLEK